MKPADTTEMKRVYTRANANMIDLGLRLQERMAILSKDHEWNFSYGNREYGHTVLQRKILEIRADLLKLSKLLDEIQ